MKLNKKTQILLLFGVVAVLFLFNGGFSLTMININKIWAVEKYFDNPWVINNGAPRVLQAVQWQSSVSETSNIITIPNTAEVIGARIEYRLTYVGGGANSPTPKIDFNGINVKTLQFMPGSYGTSQSGSVNIPLNRLQGSNQITIFHDNAWGGWSQVSYDVVLVLGYNADPIEDPGQGGGGSGAFTDFWSWIRSSTALFGMLIPNYVLVAGVFLTLLIIGRR